MSAAIRMRRCNAVPSARKPRITDAVTGPMPGTDSSSSSSP
jgi:hypothetical protein